MIVQSPASQAFQEFLAKNTAFWSERLRRIPPQSHRFVLVDLLHNNGSVLILNLLLARYLGEFLGLDVGAFIAPRFTAYPVPVEEVKQLARSFGVTRIFDIDNKPGWPVVGGGARETVRSCWRAASYRWRLNLLRTRLARHTGASLRKKILGLRIRGVPVGPLVYDSYLDIERKATVEAYDDGLHETLARTLRLSDDFHNLVASGEVGALVVSHTVYIDYGIPARFCLKHGVPVYGKVWLDPIGVRRYERLEEADEFAGMPVVPALNYFRQRLGPKLHERAEGYFPPAPQKQMNLDYFRYGYGADKTERTKHELTGLLGIDPAKKTCLIMAQQFADAPHCYPDLLFDDYYEWLDETLAFAATQPQVNWLVRQHPYEVMVGETKFFNRIAARWLKDGSPIRLVPNSVTTSSLFGCTDVVVTGIGSGGIEFASVGVPCILAGNPFYGDFDFAIRPRTREEYFAALVKIPSLPRLSERQIKAAKELALVFLDYKRVSSDLVPFINDLAGRNVTQDDIDSYWRRAAELLTARRIEADPLYFNLSKMVRERHMTLLNFGIE